VFGGVGMSAQLIENLPFEDYLAHPALSASGMKRLLDMPARFKVERPDTASMSLGRLIHAIAFDQPHTFTVKDWDGRTKDGKARAAEVAELGLEICSEDDWAVAHGIAEALRANALARSVLYSAGTRHELSAFWKDPETGVELKCRFDAVSPSWVIGDLKSTTYAKPDAFAKSAATYGYYTAAAQYRAAAMKFDAGDPQFYLVAAEKNPPHFISVNGINEFDLELGERLRRKAIRLYADCLERDEWPDYSGQIHYPDAPAWWRYMAEEETGLYDIEVA
jgi:hypothetical protein